MTDNSDISPDTDLSSMQERNEQTLTDIKNLQQIEQELYDNLDMNTTNIPLTPEQKNTIIGKINEISQMRINLYSNLKDMYSFFQKNVSSSNTTLAEQMMAIDIVENELNDSKRKLELLEDDKNNKQRLVEINTFYGKQYNAHSGIMKTVVIMCIPILIVSILANMGIFSNNITLLIIGIILIIGFVSIGSQIIDISNRDKMNFDEYNWYFNTSDAPANNTTPANSSDPWKIPTITCIGQQCCDANSTYDSVENICVVNPVTEGMAVFSKKNFNPNYSNYSNYAAF